MCFYIFCVVFGRLVSCMFCTWTKWVVLVFPCQFCMDGWALWYFVFYTQLVATVRDFKCANSAICHRLICWTVCIIIVLLFWYPVVVLLYLNLNVSTFYAYLSSYQCLFHPWSIYLMQELRWKWFLLQIPETA